MAIFPDIGRTFPFIDIRRNWISRGYFGRNHPRLESGDPLHIVCDPLERKQVWQKTLPSSVPEESEQLSFVLVLVLVLVAAVLS